MEGILVVLPLVGLALPISMLFAALVFDAAVIGWAIYQTAHDLLQRYRAGTAPLASSTSARFVVVPH